MVLIFSNKGDISTSYVIRWLNYWGCEWKRVNEANTFFSLIETDDIEIDNIKLLNIYSIWYRRNIFKDERFRLNHLLYDINQQDRRKLINHIIDEQKILLSFLTKKYLSKMKSINTADNVNISKLVQLKAAKKTGINKPESYIVSSKKELYYLILKHKKLATKPLSEALFLNGNVDSSDFGTYTQQISLSNYDSFPENFYPIFIQNYIEKLIEVRSFYLSGNFYSMAMFTQNDNQTAIDFRRYNFDKPTRTVPFKLPDNIEQKLHELMCKLNLNCGSLDILVDKSYNFYFLEVNPVGQFGMVSIPCNYYLEKIIANALKP